MVSETLDFCTQLTRLVGRKDFIDLSRRESFLSFIFLVLYFFCYLTLTIYFKPLRPETERLDLSIKGRQ